MITNWLKYGISEGDLKITLSGETVEKGDFKGLVPSPTPIF
jgi:hypothetical protein